MADQQYIDRIEEDGIVYIFTDSENRQRVVELNKLIESLKGDLNSKINEEVERAIEQEQILDNTKLDKELGKGLSSNDFTDEYKDAINSLADLKANKTDVESALNSKADISALNAKADASELDDLSLGVRTAINTANSAREKSESALSKANHAFDSVLNYIVTEEYEFSGSSEVSNFSIISESTTITKPGYIPIAASVVTSRITNSAPVSIFPSAVTLGKELPSRNFVMISLMFKNTWRATSDTNTVGYLIKIKVAYLKIEQMDGTIDDDYEAEIIG